MAGENYNRLRHQNAYSLDRQDKDFNFIKEWLMDNSQMSFKDRLLKDKVFRYQSISEEEVVCWADMINWDQLSRSMNIPKFSEDFFESFECEINWSLISANHTINFDFVKKHVDNLIPGYVLGNPALKFDHEEDFMRELVERQRAQLENHPELLGDPEIATSLRSYFKIISQSQRLSEDFMRDYNDQLDWKEVSLNQSMSMDFINVFYDKIHWDCFIKNKRVSEDIKYNCWVNTPYVHTIEPFRWRIMKDNYELKKINSES